MSDEDLSGELPEEEFAPINPFPEIKGIVERAVSLVPSTINLKGAIRMVVSLPKLDCLLKQDDE